MMDNSSNRRVFNCADPLWLPFNELAKRLNVSIDGLICEAMTVYYQQQAAALQNGSFLPVSPAYASMPYETPAPYAPSPQNPAYGNDSMPPAAPVAPPAPHAPPAASPYPQDAYANDAHRNSQSNLPGAFANVPLQNSGRAPLPPPPLPSNLGQRVTQPPQPPQGAYRKPPSLFDEANAPQKPGHLNLASLSSPHTAPASNDAMPGGAQAQPIPASMPQLYIVFANQRYLVNKDKYIIGRSSQVADLVIRDGNISRKHCAVIYKNGAYYIKDLDSTNGIEYHGKQIDTKRIDEGDQFNICEFHFTFTYKG